LRDLVLGEVVTCELSGFEIDEERHVMRKRPPTHGHGQG
jgi:hypothetical protein